MYNAFDDGEIPTPNSPGYIVSKWVLHHDNNVEITKNTKWIYENNTVVESIYEAVNYIVEYHPGEAGGTAKQETYNISYDSEFVLENNLFNYKYHKLLGWKILNSGEDITGNITMKVSYEGDSWQTSSNIINSGYKDRNVFAYQGSRVKLEPILEESVYKVEYVRKEPNSINSNYINPINELDMDIVKVETGEETIIANYNYTTNGYTMIGWSTKSDINYNDYILGDEDSLINYTKSDRVVLSTTKDELIKLYPVRKRNTYTLNIKYPKFPIANN